MDSIDIFKYLIAFFDLSKSGTMYVCIYIHVYIVYVCVCIYTFIYCVEKVQYYFWEINNQSKS